MNAPTAEALGFDIIDPPNNQEGDQDMATTTKQKPQFTVLAVVKDKRIVSELITATHSDEALQIWENIHYYEDDIYPLAVGPVGGTLFTVEEMTRYRSGLSPFLLDEVW